MKSYFICKWRIRIMEIVEFPVLFFLVIFQIHFQNVGGQPPPFIRTCQNPLVLTHINKFGHTYCFHACGYLGDPNVQDLSMCTAGGNCICNYACDSAPPAAPFGQDVCPPFMSDPVDTDPTAEPRCMASCAAQCPGGQGRICGEVEPLGPNADMYAKICLCYCPPQPCATTTTTTTTTTQATTTTTQTSVVLIKNPKAYLWLLKKKFYIWKIVLKKLWKLCLLITKLCWAYLLKCFLLGLYYYLFRQWISWEIRWILGQLRWILGGFIDFSVLDFFDL